MLLKTEKHVNASLRINRAAPKKDPPMRSNSGAKITITVKSIAREVLAPAGTCDRLAPFGSSLLLFQGIARFAAAGKSEI